MRTSSMESIHDLKRKEQDGKMGDGRGMAYH